MKKPSVGSRTLASLAAMALGSSACAEVYVPRPSGAVVITSNGSTGYRVFRHGEDMGSEWSVRDAVSGDPRAEVQADKAQSERIGSIVTGILGGAAVGVGVGLATDYAVSQSSSPSHGLEYAGLALVGGGLVLAIVGGALQGAAHTHMFNAVNIYNDDLAARGVEVRPLPATVYVTPGPGYAPQPVAPGIVPVP